MCKKSLFVIFGILLLPSVVLSAEKKYPKASSFSLRTPDRQTVELDSLVGKGPIMISFWATWCKPCCEELDRMREFYKKYKEQGLEILAISQDGPRTLSKVKPFAKSRRWEFKILLDPDRKVRRLYGVDVIPQTFLIDKDGIIRYHHRGFKAGDEITLKKEIIVLLKEFQTEEAKPKKQE